MKITCIRSLTSVTYRDPFGHQIPSQLPRQLDSDWPQYPPGSSQLYTESHEDEGPQQQVLPDGEGEGEGGGEGGGDGGGDGGEGGGDGGEGGGDGGEGGGDGGEGTVPSQFGLSAAGSKVPVHSAQFEAVS